MAQAEGDMRMNDSEEWMDGKMQVMKRLGNKEAGLQGNGIYRYWESDDERISFVFLFAQA